MTDKELREYAADILIEHVRDIEPLSIHEMADEFLGREISDDEAAIVLDLIARADISVTIPEVTS